MIDPTATAQGRLEILEEIAGMETKGVSINKACRLLDVKRPTVLRWRKQYATAGFAGLEPGWKNCGRPPEVVLNREEEAKAKELYLKTNSKTTALRMLANMPVCSDEVADVILRRRRSKHTITKTLRAQIEVPEAVKEYYKSPKKAGQSFINPRTLSYIDAGGVERMLQPGDLFERDDMSNNFLCWVPWPWGGDPCSDKYGVRVARGQNLLAIDVASLYFFSFNFLVRLRDSYRADDIWQWVHHTYRDVGKPRIGERWERGTWASRKLRGDSAAVIEPGHTDELARLGGMAGLGLRVIESQSPTTKIIENRFNFFQTVCATIPTLQIGRERGEMERQNRIWTAMREGRRDPREHCLSFDEVCNQIEAALHYVNSEPVEGLNYRGIPAQLWAEGIAKAPLAPVDDDKAYLFARDKREITACKAHVLVRVTLPDGNRTGLWFHNPELFKYEGQKISAYFDSYNTAAGATLVVAGGRDAGRVIGHGELISGCPQFALGFQTGEDTDAADRALGAYDRRKGFLDAVRSEYRTIGLGGKRGTRGIRVDDGAGRRVTISDSATAGVSGDASISGARGGNRDAAAVAPRGTFKRPEYNEAAEIDRVNALEEEARRRGDILPV